VGPVSMQAPLDWWLGEFIGVYTDANDNIKMFRLDNYNYSKDIG
jgi:hypothetical protein